MIIDIVWFHDNVLQQHPHMHDTNNSLGMLHVRQMKYREKNIVDHSQHATLEKHPHILNTYPIPSACWWKVNAT